MINPGVAVLIMANQANPNRPVAAAPKIYTRLRPSRSERYPENSTVKNEKIAPICKTVSRKSRERCTTCIP